MASYLGKGGKVFGPFSDETLESMRLSAEIENYTYVWDEASGQWFNLDPLPPAPGSDAAPPLPPSSEMSPDVICHNSQEIVAGAMENVSDLGCELVSLATSDTPALGQNTSCILNVMDGACRRAMNVKARLVETSRRGEFWVYRLRWAKRPSFAG